MKNLIGLFATLLLINFAQAQTESDIVGYWLNEEKDAKIEVYKEKDKYYGKVVWIIKDENPDGTSPKLDSKNPDDALKKQPIIGLVILKDFVFDDDEFEDGTIYDPKSGKTYSCFMKFESKDELFIKGYIGFSFIGRSSVWTRTKM